MPSHLGTIITAAVTPFDENGQVDHDVFRVLLRHLVENGSDGIVVCGTTGECPTLSDDEKSDLWRTAVDEVGGTVAVIAGTGTCDTAHSVILTRRACELGVDGVLVVTPYYNKPPREGLVRHFTHVAHAANPVPVILYNIPGRSVINLEPDLVAELAQIENVVGIKQANPDLTQLGEIRSLAPDLTVWAGDDTSLLPMLANGAVGGICVASHVVGPQMRRVVELWQSGDEAGAGELSASLDDVYETLAVAPNPIAVKAALIQLSIPVGGLRLPLVEATGMQVERIRAMLQRHELETARA
ncbi:MAG: 4-hydroxy-tetrahydrodipicolinate synthase [Thermoleophilia bacterium]|nr:4-hydroxy-tetrahydrodipicolinate synthase [Thermoleophilia bacterium]